MKTKNSIKSISIYELYDYNEQLIISVIYHIFIIIFNHYSIININNLQNTFKENEKCFDLIQYNIKICQSITLFTLFFIIYFSNEILIKNSTKDRRQLYIMIISYLIKMSIIVYQLSNCSDINLCIFNNSKSKLKFGVFYSIIECSYIIRLPVFFLGIFFFISIPILKTCDNGCIKIIEWSKTYKIRFIQQNNNNGSEDV
jgi:hypothetical protein